MAQTAPTLSASYRRYLDLLIRHHGLLSDREEEDPEIESIEDEMTGLWDELDPIQRQSLSGLGSDLNWLRRGCRSAPRGRRPEDVTPEDYHLLAQARDEADWYALLHALRLCGPALSPFELADLRALAWSELGFPEPSRLFRDIAAGFQVPCERLA